MTEGKGKGGQSTYKETGLILRSVNKQANSHQQMGVRGSLGWVLKVTGKAIFIIDQFPNVVEGSFDGRWQGFRI